MRSLTQQRMRWKKVDKAKADADSLKDKLTALLASQNYTADQVKELEGQISAAEIKLKEAEDMAKDLTDKLGIAGETLADKITELTPAPAPGEGGPQRHRVAQLPHPALKRHRAAQLPHPVLRRHRAAQPQPLQQPQQKQHRLRSQTHR